MRFASVVFDFDSTVVDCETLDIVSEIALAARDDKDAVLAEVKRITALGMEGAIPFDESLSRRIALVAPTRAAVSLVAERIVEHITPSFLARKDFFETHRGQIAIVSGGFDEIIWPVADILGIPRSLVYANEFVFDERGIAIGVDTTRASAQAGGKTRAVRAVNMQQPIVIVGDGWTDYEIKEQGVADTFIAYTEHAQREKVIAHADARAASGEELFGLLE
ncbi:MAG: phosphoglycerate dehydrogenase [Candidatus Parcubacteria bacterium]|jgi:D-3-phosphoglycerate dehydrogenase